MNLAVSRSILMQKSFFVLTSVTGIVQIDRQTGVMHWEREDLDPVSKRYAKRYLVCEGFLEQALGVLEPSLDPETVLFLDSISI
jgi:hypothetical protein